MEFLKKNRSDEVNSLMLEGTSEGLWLWLNSQSEQQIWNSKLYELLGYEWGEIPPHYSELISLIHPEDKEEVICHFEKLKGSQRSFDINFRIKTKDKGYSWFRCAAQSVNGEGQKIIPLVGSIQNIDKRVLAEQDLKRSNEELDQFAYVASHDLREPLRGIRNFAQFMIEDYSDKLDEQGVQNLNTIKKLGSRLDNYLESLLYFSRLGREKLACRMVGLNELLEDIKVVHLDPSVKNVSIDVQKGLPVVNCDPVKISKIIGNLLSNAIKYNLSEEKRIKIQHLKLPNSYHKFTITDNGIGIKKEYWDRIFIIFKRLHSKEDYGGGTGLGLTIAKKAVEQHGGEIKVESSEEGKGTVISFTIMEKRGDV